MLIPVEAIPDIMTNLPAGFYTYSAFYDNFLAPPLGSGDAALEQRFTPLAQWGLAVCTAAKMKHNRTVSKSPNTYIATYTISLNSRRTSAPDQLTSRK